MTVRLILCSSLAMIMASTAGSPWQWKSDGKRSVELIGASGPVARFLVDPDPADPHFDILATSDGRNMVWVSPPDHVWHYGHWFSWKVINGVNFWETDRKTGRSRGLTEVRDPAIDLKPDRATVSYRRLYRLPDADDPIMQDQFTITIRTPEDRTGPVVDWQITTTALADLTLDRTPVPGEPGGKSWGGYCGLSWRGAKGLKDLSVIDSEGRKGADIHRRHAKWVNATGTLDGKPAGIAILSHRNNPGQPVSWYVLDRAKLPFWYLNPSLVQPEPVPLKQGATLTHRYRIVIHDGAFNPSNAKW